MKLLISDKDKFVNNFLSPLSRVVDSAVINIDKGKITTLIATSDNTIIVSSTFNDTNIDIKKTLNIPDLKKLNRVISCIEPSAFELDVSSNFIGYTSNTIRFKYHLYDDNIISSPKVNIDKINALEFDGKFTLLQNTILSLIKGSTITTESNKIYLSVKNGSVFGELTDKTRPNIDSYGIEISNNYDGTQFAVPIPLNFEIFRIISSMKFKDIQFNLITKMGVGVLDLNQENTSFKFIISALTN